RRSRWIGRSARQCKGFACDPDSVNPEEPRAPLPREGTSDRRGAVAVFHGPARYCAQKPLPRQADGYRIAQGDDRCQFVEQPQILRGGFGEAKSRVEDRKSTRL